MSLTFSPVKTTCTGQVHGRQPEPCSASYGLDKVEMEKYLECCYSAEGKPKPFNKFLDDILLTRKENLGKIPTTKKAKNCDNAPLSGTWQFMSADLLRNPGFKRNTFQDDLESFFWVILYTTMGYMDTTLSQFEPEPEDAEDVADAYRDRCASPEPETDPGSHLAATMSFIFDTMYQKSRPPFSIVGGIDKQRVISRKAYIARKFAVLNNTPLTKLVHRIIRIIREYQLTMGDLVGEMEGEKLENVVEMLAFANGDVMMKFMRDALGEVDWPIGDGPVDHLKASYESDTESMA